MNAVDPWGLWTFGIDYSGTGGAGAGGTGGKTYVIDSHGNYGTVNHAGGGGYFGAGGGAAGQYQITSADTINDLAGPSASIGGSVGEGLSPTGEIFFSDSYKGINLGASYGGGAIPFEVHSFVENSSVNVNGNIWNDIGKFIHQLFGKDGNPCN